MQGLTRHSDGAPAARRDARRCPRVELTTMTTLSREGAIVQLEKLTARVCQCVADGGDTNALDLLMTTPSRPGDEEEATQVTVDSGVPGLGRLTQLWVVIGVLHGVMTKGKKLTQARHIAPPPPPSCRLAHLHMDVRCGSASSGTASSRRGCSRTPKRSTGGS